jgi:hypothetical protein
MVKPGKLSSLLPTNFAERSLFKPKIEQEIRSENEEKKLITGKAEKFTKIEFKTVEDIANALNEIEQIIESHKNNLPKEERVRIAQILNKISDKEEIFKKSVRSLQGLIQRLGTVDAQNYGDLKERLEKATGKEKRLIKAEIEDEEGKIGIERTFFEFERKLTQTLSSFNQHLKVAIDQVSSSPHPYDAVGPLAEARKVLINIIEMIKETEQLEEKLVNLIKTEKKLLKKERRVA